MKDILSTIPTLGIKVTTDKETIKYEALEFEKNEGLGWDKEILILHVPDYSISRIIDCSFVEEYDFIKEVARYFKILYCGRYRKIDIYKIS